MNQINRLARKYEYMNSMELIIEVAQLLYNIYFIKSIVVKHLLKISINAVYKELGKRKKSYRK